MAALDRVLELNFKSEDEEQLLSDGYDWALPRAFQEERHVDKVEGRENTPQCWRMKERMKTVSVALVMCLNVGVDPPGVVKMQPCARLECWVDPLSMSAQKALESIGANLQKQYERWQPRARYKQSLDPTVDEVKKLCTSLRRNAKDERVLFHYNGHGVPQPTTNGEIWVFNRNYTQYIPLSIYDLQTWMGSPSIYVYDCSNAGLIVKSFHQFAEQHQKEYDEMLAKSPALSNCPPPNFTGCIQLAACGETQSLPMNPDLPADLFTACLTTPIKTALRWFVLQNKDKLLPNITQEMVEKIPGQLNDRRTMLGELNWIFTAITDTIAWNILPRHLFQRLFRQDLLVASLFRNFLLAERIMRTYDCSPVSSPKLPPTYKHPMWNAWDLALDLCLAQLPQIIEDMKEHPTSPVPPGNGNGGNGNTATSSVADVANGSPHTPSPFFEEQLTAFQVWLTFGNDPERAPPEQLPIVLQVLLSQVHRVRALELLGRFLDLGWLTVNLALSVGIFPYVLKLLQSSAKELRPLLVFIWAKILAVDHTCQSDLVRDGSHKYFIAMIGDTTLPFEHRTMAIFVLANIVRNFRSGQQAVLQANAIAVCLEALDESDAELRRWVCICLGLTWAEFPSARWCGVRDSAHEKIYNILEDPNPEVRAAAVFALGTFINSSNERSEHSNSIDHSIAMTIISKLGTEEASPLVRMEITVALHNFVLAFENNFITIEQQQIAAQELKMASPAGGNSMRRISSHAKMRLLANANPLATVTGAETHNMNHDSMRRVASSSSLSSLSFSPLSAAGSVGGIYGKVWATITTYEKDPYHGVALLARTVLQNIRIKAKEAMKINGGNKLSLSLANSSISSTGSGGPSVSISSVASTPIKSNTGTVTSGSGARRTPSPDPTGSGDITKSTSSFQPLIGTKYIEWCWDRFARPSAPGSVVLGTPLTCCPSTTYVDPHDPIQHTRDWRYVRNSGIRRECFRRPKAFPGKIDEQMFSSRSLHSSHGSSPSSAASSPSFNFSLHSAPSLVRLHDYEKLVVASEGSVFSLYDLTDTSRLICKSDNSSDSRITAIDWINAHDESLIIIGTDDGSVRVWKPDLESGKPRLITAWNALSDLGLINKSSKSYGLHLKWDLEGEKVLASGDTKIVRTWDIKTELRKGDYPTGFDCPVTSIDMHRCEPQLAVLGMEEGAVRLIDFRLPPAECGVVTWREFGDGWIVGATLRYDRTVVAGNANGRVRFFDLRSKSPTKTCETGTDITALAIHPHLPYFAGGCLNHSVNVYGFMGQSAFQANAIRDSLFITGRMGAVTSLHFHPYKSILATADSCSVNVYKTRGLLTL
ncbi:regulatory-associated protein of mTOR isoform X2 [Folsomia candida]|uniref:regulatory-associated protein of mTOR isoform X2 n=1 Tax=Folsomia candida TaxID=158441 RepID=UPI000B9023BC|nr:regulatory-associated protein of mTOR isoform X2 [Folsomia candida]